MKETSTGTLHGRTYIDSAFRCAVGIKGHKHIKDEDWLDAMAIKELQEVDEPSEECEHEDRTDEPGDGGDYDHPPSDAHWICNDCGHIEYLEED